MLTKQLPYYIIISGLAFTTFFDAWLSLVERCVRDAEVAGSNPVASTKKRVLKSTLFL